MAAGDEGMSWLKNLFRSRYVAKLEVDNARLLEENRALMNSLLGTAGVSPIETGGTPQKADKPVRRPTWGQTARRLEAVAGRALRMKPEEDTNAVR